MGPNLVDMSDEDIMNAVLTRLTFLQLTAQSYCLLKNLLSPLITTTKALASCSYELASIDELELDLASRDPEFIAWIKKFLINLKNIGKIRPFDRGCVPTGYRLAGFVVSMDGGKAAYMDTIHCLSENKGALYDSN